MHLKVLLKARKDAFEYQDRIKKQPVWGPHQIRNNDKGGGALDIYVSVGDMKISDDPTATIVTHSLGSCIGLAVYDPSVKVGGVLHYMLPDSTKSNKSKSRPFMFADTGIPLLFKSCYELGARKTRMVVKAAGGSQVIASSEKFEIGKRNHAALRKILFRNNVMIRAEDVGGCVARTMRPSIATGEVSLKIAGQDYNIL